jgi:phytoene dehydrogenase-like protein
MRADVCVVGGGIAGLAVAAQLVAAGLTVTVLEAADRAGGRARDERIDGFTVSDGGHLLHTSWTALQRCAPPAGLALGCFAPGVRVLLDGRRVRFGAAPIRPQQAFSTLRTPIGSAADKARLSKVLYRLAAGGPERALAGAEHSSADSFAVRGYSAELVEQFLRPYLTGLAADEDLATSIRGADWLLRLLVRGRFAVPGEGVGAIARELVRRLPRGTLQLGTRVTSVRADRVLSEAGEVRAGAVVVAADPYAAVELLPGLHEPRMRAVTTLWHIVDDAEIPPDPERSPSVLVDAEPGSPVARTAVVSRAAPTLAPPGRALVATTVFGDDGKQLPALDRAVLERLAELHGSATRHWETLDIRHVEHALVTMPAPYNFAQPVRLIRGLYVCGDHRDLPNVEGALQSAHRAATAVLEDLKARRQPA